MTGSSTLGHRTTGGSTLGYLSPDDPEAIGAMWQTFKGYTVRPVPSTESYYQSVLERLHRDGDQVLIYGGTPEVRDCAGRLGANAVLVDRSRVMVEAMGLLTTARRALGRNERFVEADWLDIPLPDGSFDIAIGDDAINMVDWTDFGAFLSTTARLLRPGGHFVCHLLVQPAAELRRR